MNDPITPFSGLEKLIEDFIKEQNNELINKKRSTSDPINQVIKKTDGGKVLMTLGPVIFKERKAIGVEVKKNNHSEIYYCNKEIILSSGSINSPKILQLSGIGDAELLSNNGIAK